MPLRRTQCERVLDASPANAMLRRLGAPLLLLLACQASAHVTLQAQPTARTDFSVDISSDADAVVEKGSASVLGASLNPPTAKNTAFLETSSMRASALTRVKRMAARVVKASLRRVERAAKKTSIASDNDNGAEPYPDGSDYVDADGVSMDDEEVQQERESEEASFGFVQKSAEKTRVKKSPASDEDDGVEPYPDGSDYTDADGVPMDDEEVQQERESEEASFGFVQKSAEKTRVKKSPASDEDDGVEPYPDGSDYTDADGVPMDDEEVQQERESEEASFGFVQKSAEKTRVKKSPASDEDDGVEPYPDGSDYTDADGVPMDDEEVQQERESEEASFGFVQKSAEKTRVKKSPASDEDDGVEPYPDGSDYTDADGVPMDDEEVQQERESEEASFGFLQKSAEKTWVKKSPASDFVQK